MAVGLYYIISEGNTSFENGIGIIHTSIALNYINIFRYLCNVYVVGCSYAGSHSVGVRVCCNVQ